MYTQKEVDIYFTSECRIYSDENRYKDKFFSRILSSVEQDDYWKHFQTFYITISVVFHITAIHFLQRQESNYTAHKDHRYLRENSTAYRGVRKQNSETQLNGQQRRHYYQQ